MARVKRAVNAQKKRRTTLEAASGYRGQRSRLYRKAKEQLLHSATYAYRDRKARKGDFRKLWITRINAAARLNDMTYNRFMQGLKLAGIELDRRVLAELAVNEPAAFAALVETARAAVAAAPATAATRPPDPGSTHVPTPSVTGPSGPAPAASASVCPEEADMSELLTERSARIVAARKLTRRSGRDDAGLFLAEGRQAVAEALADPDGVREVFATEAAAAAHHDLLAGTAVPVRLVTEKAAAGLSETVTPQGLVAVCALRDVPRHDAGRGPAAAGGGPGRARRPRQRRHRAADGGRVRRGRGRVRRRLGGPVRRQGGAGRARAACSTSTSSAAPTWRPCCRRCGTPA